MMPTTSINEGLPSSIVFIFLLLSIIGFSVYKYFKEFRKSKTIKNRSYTKSFTPISVKEANNKNRKLGSWTPEIFEYPTVEEFKGWSITDTEPLPYRAFKHTYFFTMGIRSMDWTSWIELDNEWMKYHNRKVERIAERGHELLGTQSEVWDGVIELLMELREFLPARYPTLFTKTDKGINNIVTKEVFEFVDIPKSEFKKDPMEMAALMTQDDLAILKENEKGEYILKGGAIMLAGFWRLKDKLNLPLSAIHTTGDVPKYNEKLKRPMEKFFSRLTCDKPVVRNNYFLQTDDDVAWSSSIGPEDVEIVGWNTAKPATDINNIYYRSERQSVRRLPLSGCIVFTIRTYFLPITKMCEEPHIPKRLLDGILSWDDDVKTYRGYDKFKDVLMPYLEEQTEIQESKGINVANEVDSYPF